VVAGTKMMNIDLARARFVGVSVVLQSRLTHSRWVTTDSRTAHASIVTSQRHYNILTLLLASADIRFCLSNSIRSTVLRTTAPADWFGAQVEGLTIAVTFYDLI
jgi:hypothetical protein